jgi:hypothetical protein
MNNKKLFTWLAVVAESVGFGILVGYTLGNGENNSALWVAGILIFLGAISLGMAISHGQTVNPPNGNSQEKIDSK